MLATKTAVRPEVEADAFTPVYEKIGEIITNCRARGPMKHSDLEEMLYKELLDVGRRLYQGALDEAGPGQVSEPVRDAKGRIHPDERRQTRRLMTRFGPVEVNRIGYALPGQESLHPLDAQLNLPPELYSHSLRRLASESSANNSIDQVIHHLSQSTGAKVPKRQVEQLIRRGARDFTPFYEQRAADACQVEASGEILALSFDGKGVPMLKAALREETRKAAEWNQSRFDHHRGKGERLHSKRMGTVAAVYTTKPFVRTPEQIGGEFKPVRESLPRRPRPENKRVWASIQQPPEEIISQAFEEARKRDPAQTKQWVVLLDGNLTQLGLAINAAEETGVKVTFILDLIHVLEYLWKAAWAFHSTKDQAGLWVGERLLEILRGRSSQVASGMTGSATKRGLSAKAREPVDKCAQYLLKYREFLRYDEYLKAGYPIATGVIEGACRYLVKDRMEITGARWSLEGAEAVLQLRSVWASGDFDEYWEFHLQQEYKRNHQALYENGQVPLPTPKPEQNTRASHLRLVK
jgi:hypothetical protein